MSYATFSPPKNPDAPLDIASSPRMLNPQFGQGFPTFDPDGENTVLKSVTLKWSVLTFSEYTTIDTFMAGTVSTPFLFTLPDETIARLWLMTGRVKRAQPTLYEYEVSLKEQPLL